MAVPALLSRAQHDHVTEREVAHRWPDGQWDNGSWEDCTFTAGVELARLCKNKNIPSTHTEVEHLRDDAGEDPTGGTNQDDLWRGLLRRYKWVAPTPIRGFSALWSALKPGYAASCSGVMGIFPYGHRLRRWQPSFNGLHDVLIVRVDGTDRVWWCDPLAPEGKGYQGEWVTKAELKRYVDAITAAGGKHIVAKVRNNYWCAVADGARLYVRSDLKPTAKDIIIHPGPRMMPYKGQATAAAKKVEYVNAKKVRTGRFYFAKNSAITGIRAL